MTAYQFEIQHIHQTFHKGTANEHHVLKGIDLKVKKGDFICLIGGNGSGKSTLLNAISGSFPIDEGKLLLKQKEIQSLKEYQRAKFIGRVFQDPNLGTSPRMTIAENLSIAQKRGAKRSFIKRATSSNAVKQFSKEVEMLELGLENRLNTEIGLLSGGQRQAITLLMSVLQKPELLLLDEHTAALDPKIAKFIMKKTNELITKQHLTAMMVTHNLQDALSYGNRLIMMQAGKIVLDLNQTEKEKMTVEELYQLFSQ
ncbi:ABC transporter ATP-binding protein [Isobaculum melis]|uniref:Putative ABC transport system ATP-binding protein n=1 Tax=Isobaculum melis TaxID=142588 RepID=A0A1H9T1I7_9LACT|nr:ATP-binding cassette domain-containing protein [Isobaculum melis]SER90579.1 putative ABC transport system ATP-binding protein [Isobaculum melis]